MQSNFEKLVIDGHVHFHECFDEAQFFAAAYANLSRQSAGTPTLFLTEMAGQHVFARWLSGSAAWPVTVTGEPFSLLLGHKLLVIAGRQIVTSERIEVLAVGCIEDIVNDLPLDATIEAVREAGAVPVLPWGVGKWSGERGRLIADAAARHRVLLGDNAGRPVGWPQPELFRQHVVLAGTDPLQLRSEQERVGTYGFVLEGQFNSELPVSAIVSALEKLTQRPTSFGRRVGPFSFLRQQLGLRLAQ
jgi:hypothetical protein